MDISIFIFRLFFKRTAFKNLALLKLKVDFGTLWIRAESARYSKMHPHFLCAVFTQDTYSKSCGSEDQRETLQA